MSLIHYVRVEITPYTYGPEAPGRQELRISVEADGVRHGFVEVLRRTDFETVFERIMDAATREILRLVKANER